MNFGVLNKIMSDRVKAAGYSEESDSRILLQQAEPELQAPPMYHVIMLNDDYTPMDFVVEVLEDFFAMSRELATHTMMLVHNQGQAVCGVFTRDVAETKAMQVGQYARECEHPLQCMVKPESD